jgi:hypothetical protein
MAGPGGSGPEGDGGDGCCKQDGVYEWSLTSISETCFT